MSRRAWDAGLMRGLLVARLVDPLHAAGAVPTGEPWYLSGPDPWGVTVRLALGLAVVVGLILATRWLLRQAGPHPATSFIRLREVRRLASQHTVYVVDVGSRRLLLGSGLTVLADLGEAERMPKPASFAEGLRAATRRMRPPREVAR